MFELQAEASDWGQSAPLTFLHGLERVVGFDEFDGVRDLLTLQHVVAQAEVGHGQLEHFVVSGCVLLKDGAWMTRMRASETPKISSDS